MYCSKCGTQNVEGARFCHNCGEKLVTTQPVESEQCSQTNTATQDLNNRSFYTQTPPACNKLGWHKFLVNFLLIIDAIGIIFIAYSYISGTGFGENRDYIVSNFPDAVRVVKINGFLYLALAIYIIDTRNHLAKFRSGAPGRLTLMYVLQLALAIVGNLMIAPVFEAEYIITGLVIPPVLYAVFWICVNHAYYKNREQLFVN